MKPLNISSIGLSAFVMIMAGSSQAYYWTINPEVFQNSSTPDNFKPLAATSAKVWYWTGAGHYPHYDGRTTGRDCGSGDSWFSDDDDGYNVIDYWNKCNGGWSVCGSGVLASTVPIDVYNLTSEFAEADIVMCSGWSWNSGHAYSSTTHNYRGVLAHELGHLIGLWDHDANTRATMYYQAIENGYPYQALNKTDIDRIRSKYGVTGNWQLSSNGGYAASVSSRDNAGVAIYGNPKGVGTNWGNPIIATSDRLGGWIQPTSYLEWDEYDNEHAFSLGLWVVGVDGVKRALVYSRNNHSGWWNQQGWVNLSTNPDWAKYNQWVHMRQNVWNDFKTEYGIDPLYADGMFAWHFMLESWNTTKGGEAKNIYLHRE